MFWKKRFWTKILRHRKPAPDSASAASAVAHDDCGRLDINRTASSSPLPNHAIPTPDQLLVPPLDESWGCAATFPGNQQVATLDALSSAPPINVRTYLSSTPPPDPTSDPDVDSLPLDAAMSPSPANTETTLPIDVTQPRDGLKLPQAREALALVEILCGAVEGLEDLIRVAQIAKEKIMSQHGIDLFTKPKLAPSSDSKLPPPSPPGLDAKPQTMAEVTDVITEGSSPLIMKRSVDPTDEEVFVHPTEFSDDPALHCVTGVADTPHGSPTTHIRFPDASHLEDLRHPTTFGSNTVDGRTNSPRASPRTRSTSMDMETLSTPRMYELLFDHAKGGSSRPATIHEIEIHHEEAEERCDTSSVNSLPLLPEDAAGVPRVRIWYHERHLHSFRSTPRMPFDISTQHISEPIAEGRTCSVSRVLRPELEVDYEAVKSVDLNKQSDVTLKWCAREVQMMKMLYGIQRGPLPYRPGTPENAREYIINFPSDPLESCIWVDPFGILNISTCYYPYDLWQFRGASTIGAPDETIAQHPEAVYFILYELTQGLRFLHSIGIVHLDIQPSNIFLTNARHCVIGDFGGSVAGAWEEVFDTSLATYAPRAFAAPELLDASTFDSRADFWSLGMTMFDLIVPDGIETLLGAEDDAETKQLGYPFRGPKRLGGMMRNNKCPEDVINQVTNMLQKGPLDRAHGKSILKYLKDHQWQEKFTTSEVSPLLKFEPAPRASLSKLAMNIVPSGLPPWEVVRKLRDEVYALCEYEVHVRG